MKEGEIMAIFGYLNQVSQHQDPYHPLDKTGVEEFYQRGYTKGPEALKKIRKDWGDIIHRIPTVQGQSGSPIVIITKDYAVKIIGIHKGVIKLEKK